MLGSINDNFHLTDLHMHLPASLLESLPKSSFGWTITMDEAGNGTFQTGDKSIIGWQRSGIIRNFVAIETRHYDSARGIDEYKQP